MCMYRFQRFSLVKVCFKSKPKCLLKMLHYKLFCKYIPTVTQEQRSDQTLSKQTSLNYCVKVIGPGNVIIIM